MQMKDEKEKTLTTAMQAQHYYTHSGILLQNNFHTLRQNVSVEKRTTRKVPICLPGFAVHSAPRLMQMAHSSQINRS